MLRIDRFISFLSSILALAPLLHGCCDFTEPSLSVALDVGRNYIDLETQCKLRDGIYCKRLANGC